MTSHISKSLIFDVQGFQVKEGLGSVLSPAIALPWLKNDVSFFPQVSTPLNFPRVAQDIRYSAEHQSARQDAGSRNLQSILNNLGYLSSPLLPHHRLHLSLNEQWSGSFFVRITWNRHLVRRVGVSGVAPPLYLLSPFSRLRPERH